MSERESDSSQRAFYSLSAALTGFDTFDLHATGVGDTYFATAQARLGEATLGALLRGWQRIEREQPNSSDARDAALTREILQTAEFGPSARRIIMLWYTGSWYASPDDASVVSPQAYTAGLMWQAVGGHAMGANPQGFGAWTLPPPTTDAEPQQKGA